MAMRIKGDVIVVRRIGDPTVDALAARVASDPQVKIDGDLVAIALPADTPPVEFAAAVRAARGRSDG